MTLGVTRSTVWGERVGIRPLLPTDAAAIRRFVTLPEVADLLFEEYGAPVPSTLTLAAAIGAQWMGGLPDWAIMTREGKVIGEIRLWRISDRNRSAMLTIYIGDPAQWGRGCGTEALRLALRQAFGTMELHRVELHVFDFNRRAIRSYEKAGFIQEGLRRQALQRNGRFHDILVMGILRHEFLRLDAEAPSLPARGS